MLVSITLISEGNVIVGYHDRFLWRFNFTSRLLGWAAALWRQHAHAVDDNLGGAAFVSVAVIPLAGLQLALDVGQLSFSEQILTLLGQLPPGYDVVPLGFLLSLTRLVVVALVGGQTEIADRGAAASVSSLRVASQPTDQNCLVDHSSSVLPLPFLAYGPQRG